MRNMLAFLAALVIATLATGWYLDWYRIRTTPAPSGQRSITVDVNTAKIGDDLHRAEEKIEKRLADRAHGAADEKPAPKRAREKPTFDGGIDVER